MYRGTPYLNRHLKKRQEQRSMQYHLSNLTQIRPRTSTIQYSTEIHINNKKGELQKQARFTEIQRENRILLEKISSIMGKNPRKGDSQQKINRSLNSQFRKRQLQNIQIQNAKLLRRLQQKKPNYQTEKFKQSWKKQKYVIKNLSNYPFIINDRKKRRSSVSQIGGRDHKANTIQLCRMRIIDGVSFLITVRLNQQKMQIIGDTKDKKEIKVIQIQRSEAIEFIEQECQAKIEKIFDCLRYDKVDQVLYLVANEVEMDEVKNESPALSKQMKRQENPEFDISLENDPSKDNGEMAGEIPIRVSNGDKKYWVEVERKEDERLEQQKSSQKQKESAQSNNQNTFQQFKEQSSISNKKTPHEKEEKKQASTISNNPRSRKFTQQKQQQPQKPQYSEIKSSPKKQTQTKTIEAKKLTEQKHEQVQQPLPSDRPQQKIAQSQSQQSHAEQKKHPRSQKQDEVAEDQYDHPQPEQEQEEEQIQNLDEGQEQNYEQEQQGQEQQLEQMEQNMQEQGLGQNQLAIEEEPQPQN